MRSRKKTKKGKEAVFRYEGGQGVGGDAGNPGAGGGGPQPNSMFKTGL